MSFLSSFGKRPPPKTQQVARPTPEKANSNGTSAPKPKSQSSTAAPKPANGTLRSRADFLRDDKKHRKPTPPKKTTHLSSALQNDRKRKSATPTAPQFDSDDEEEERSLDEILHATKRAKQNGARVDLNRKLRDIERWQKESESVSALVHGADLTSGVNAKDFSPLFPQDNGEIASVELQYPGSTRSERFELVHPRKVDGYKPLSDISETIEQMIKFFLPEGQRKDLLDDMTGVSRMLRKALNASDLAEFRKIIVQFNEVLAKARQEQAIQKELDQSHEVPFPLLERILDQVTVRTVSPHSETLRDYESFSSNAYGELREQFNSQIFCDTEMTSSSVFLDLGSGVGNVVLQAALEIGCESYGIEMMPNPCRLAHGQAQEFKARCEMWGLSTGKVELLDGDFIEDSRLAPILAKADVVLINNEVFSAGLNEKLRARFLDLKEGAKIVSLKSFVPPGWRLTERTSEDPVGVLEVEKKDYWSGCVSWTDKGGHYYISTKDSSRIERILNGKR